MLVGLRRARPALVVIGVALVIIGVAGATLDWGADDGRTVTTTGSASSSSAAASTSSTSPEDPQVFFDAFETAVRTGDRAFLFSRLHPAVIERYGEAQCQDSVAQLVDPTVDLHLVSVDGPATFDYATDGLSTPVPNTFVFNVDGTGAGRTGPRQFHLAQVDGMFRSFTDCGSPIATSGTSS